MVSIPDSPTKTQGYIVLPSTLEEAIEMLLAKDVLLEQKDKELETVHQDLDTEREYTVDLRDQVLDMERRVDVSIQAQIYQHTLFANPDLSPSEKLVLLASRSVVRELRTDDDTSLTDFHLKLTQYSCATASLSMLPLLLLMQSYPI